MKKAVWLITIVSSLLLLVLFFQKSTERETVAQEQIQKHTVVTTIYPLYYLTKNIAGGQIKVNRLIKPGNEIHSFSPTPAEMVALDKSDLLITLGKDLEPWTQKLSAATSVKVLSLEDGLSLIHTGEDHHDKQQKGKHHHGGINPHVWLDFDNDIKMIKMIRDTLTELYPKYSVKFLENSSLLIEKFEKLKKVYSQGLKKCDKQILLVGHDAFGYMEKRYGFKTESIMGVFAHSRPNAAKIVALSDLIKSEKLHYLFSDPIESSKSASQLANDMNLTLEPLYTLGNISLKDEKNGEDMITLLHLDLVQFRKGLECR